MCVALASDAFPESDADARCPICCGALQLHLPLYLLTAQVDEAFDECDLQHDGKIPASELYVAILLLYHRINAMSLGGGLKKPPNR